MNWSVGQCERMSWIELQLSYETTLESVYNRSITKKDQFSWIFQISELGITKNVLCQNLGTLLFTHPCGQVWC